MTGTLHCPIDRERLDRLIGENLRAGRCLLLIDGLDEISSASDRAHVVERVTSFVATHQPCGNRFVCTSRISGYAAAPLPSSFTGVRLLEMDDEAIARFLRGYVPAIERAESADKAESIISQDAERTIHLLLAAFAQSPGVRRLAANPLLLTALLLVHRTHGNLPQRRVDAYKAVADALGHTWRAYQGIPETELPDERLLSGWLTRLAEWMHAERPEGSVTLRDLLEILGPSWAQLNRQPWDPVVLDEPDLASTDAGSGIIEFVERVDRHCGLLVERAPRRWGFPHLTFEEYYAGRALAFGREGERAVRVRRRLHDARWEEPILLAMGLVGIDYAEEIDELIDTSLLGRGEEAQRIGLRPHALEDLLGRDFRFVLRVIADDIPASPQLVDEMLGQAIDEALHGQGRGRYPIYREALLDRLEALKPVGAGMRHAELLSERTPHLRDSRALSRFVDLAARCPAHEPITNFLSMIATTVKGDVSNRAARVLAAQGALPASVISDLTKLIHACTSVTQATDAARVLATEGPLPAAVRERLVHITVTHGNAITAPMAAQVLAMHGPLHDSICHVLVQGIMSTNSATESANAAQALAAGRPLPEQVTARLAAIVATTKHDYTISGVVEVLSTQRALPAGTASRLIELLGAPDNDYASANAARVLTAHGLATAAIRTRLIDLITTTAHEHAACLAADVLAEHGHLPDAASARLTELFEMSRDNYVVSSAARVLGPHGSLPEPTCSRLVELVADSSNGYAATSAARLLSAQRRLSERITARLVELVGADNSRAYVALWRP